MKILELKPSESLLKLRIYYFLSRWWPFKDASAIFQCVLPSVFLLKTTKKTNWKFYETHQESNNLQICIKDLTFPHKMDINLKVKWENYYFSVPLSTPLINWLEEWLKSNIWNLKNLQSEIYKFRLSFFILPLFNKMVDNLNSNNWQQSENEGRSWWARLYKVASKWGRRPKRGWRAKRAELSPGC